MEQVSHATFYRDFIRAHWKGETPPDLEELTDDSLRQMVVERYPNNPEWMADLWIKTEIPSAACFVAHPEIHQVIVTPKGANFCEFVESIRPDIDKERIPFSREIKAGIREPYIPLLVAERSPGKFSILDGQLRIVTLIYHHVSQVTVYLWRGERAL